MGHFRLIIVSWSCLLYFIFILIFRLFYFWAQYHQLSAHLPKSWPNTVSPKPRLTTRPSQPTHAHMPLSKPNSHHARPFPHLHPTCLLTRPISRPLIALQIEPPVPLSSLVDQTTTHADHLVSPHPYNNHPTHTSHPTFHSHVTIPYKNPITIRESDDF